MVNQILPNVKILVLFTMSQIQSCKQILPFILLFSLFLLLFMSLTAFLILFMNFTVLFQLTFTFIYNIFSKKISILAE